MTMNCETARALLPAAADLDLAHALSLDTHISGCAACTREQQAQQALTQALRKHAPYQRLPDTLRARLHQSVPLAAPTVVAPPAARRWPALQWAIPLAAALLLGVGVDRLLRLPPAGAELADDVVAGHVRSLLAGHLDDVASSDQHTVKPWFAGKLDYSPPVRDLAAQGYPLAGGRLDYLDHRSVAALDYRRHQHVINLFVWPETAAGSSTPVALNRNGYHLEHWRAEGMQWWAVSDLNGAELRAFADMLRGAAAAP